MASIVKRKSKYSVVYDYTDENGKRRQRWETFSTNAEAKKRKKQIEYEQDSGTFFIPTAKTLNDLLDEYMSIYGVNTWAMSTYESRRGLARNYITPIIGDMLLLLNGRSRGNLLYPTTMWQLIPPMEPAAPTPTRFWRIP